ncbi:MAG: beta-glucosidase, partial [Paraglaciecola sp.]
MIKNPKDTAIKNRVMALLSNMTLQQKVGQMTQAERTTCSPEQAKKYHIGSILSSAGSCPGNN